MATILQACLGVGGHSHVIKAKRSDMGEDIAIKILPAGDSHTSNELFAVSNKADAHLKVMYIAVGLSHTFACNSTRGSPAGVYAVFTAGPFRL